MKPIHFLLLASVVLLSSCLSSKRLMEKGRYDKSIEVAVKKLIRKPDNVKQTEVLKRSFEFANRQDNDRIKYLRLSGQPDIWPEVFQRLENMKYRQERVRLVSSAVLKKIGFEPQDYDLQIVEAKRNAAGYFFANGNRLLLKGDRFNARLAYDEFSKVKQYSPSYPDLETKLSESNFKGTSFVFFSMNNRSGIPLPPRFEEELFRISLHDLNSRWITFHTQKNDEYPYSYNVRLNIQSLVVSPERIKEKNYSEQKKVEDGWEYVLDKNGNVMKDTLGNDVKVRKYSIISCDIIETNLNKSSLVGGTLDFIDLTTNQLIKTDPIAAEFFFQHRFAVGHGNFSALKPETIELTKFRPIPFPPDPEMLMRANDIVKQMTKEIIVRNRHLLR